MLSQTKILICRRRILPKTRCTHRLPISLLCWHIYSSMLDISTSRPHVYNFDIHLRSEGLEYRFLNQPKNEVVHFTSSGVRNGEHKHNLAVCLCNLIQKVEGGSRPCSVMVPPTSRIHLVLLYLLLGLVLTPSKAKIEDGEPITCGVGQAVSRLKGCSYLSRSLSG